MNQRQTILRICMGAIGSALVFILSFIISIPIPATNGYLNFGDCIILLLSFCFGPLMGAVCGAVGSTIADLLIAPQWAIFTFFIKGIEGFLAGYIFRNNAKSKNVSLIMSAIISIVVMIGLYFLMSTILYGYTMALTELVFNLIQGGSSIILACLLYKFVSKIAYFDILNQKLHKGVNQHGKSNL